MANEISVMNIDDTDYKIKDNDVRNMLTREFLESNSYNVGDAAIYEGKLYKCTETTTGAWDATKWKETTAEALVKELEVRAFEAIGILSDLRTQEKGSLVGAVNELVEDASSGIGAQFMEITGDTGYTSTVDFIKGLVQGITVVGISESVVLKNELGLSVAKVWGTLYVVKLNNYRNFASFYDVQTKKNYYMIYSDNDTTFGWKENFSGVDIRLPEGTNLFLETFDKLGLYRGTNCTFTPEDYSGEFNIFSIPVEGDFNFSRIQFCWFVDNNRIQDGVKIYTRNRNKSGSSWSAWLSVGMDRRFDLRNLSKVTFMTYGDDRLRLIYEDNQRTEYTLVCTDSGIIFKRGTQVLWTK